MTHEQLKALIPYIPTEQLAELINSTDCGLDRAGIPPYIQENDEDAHECIFEHLQSDVTRLLKAVGEGRFRYGDKFIIWDNEMEEIYTFTTNEELFQHISIDVIAECFEQNGIELTINATHNEN